MNDLAQIKCQTLQGVGPKIANYLAKCGIHTLQDLLFHLPSRYEDRSKITPINQAKPHNSLLIKGIIQHTLFKPRKGHYYRLQDETGSLALRFPHLTHQQSLAFKIGTSLLCFGIVRSVYKKPFELEMIHPDYQFLQPHTKPILPTYLTAIYPTTKGLTQRTWHKLIQQVFTLLNTSTLNPTLGPLSFPDYLSQSLLKTIKLPDLLSAITYLHRPPVNAPLAELASGKHHTQQRLILEELLAHSLAIRTLKKNRKYEKAPALKPQNELAKRFLSALPFQLTIAQQRVIQEISTDIAKPCPMQRLLQGDVGSGKTIVAAFVGIQAIENHYQVALMAPTELLSEQHYQHFHRWLTPLGCHVVCLHAKLQTKTKRHILTEIENGKAQIVIGTHALFQENVKFEKLGLIIIDEQHRFGVQQRLSLWRKGQNEYLQAHQLFMTATPIPRTLAMTSLTDLDISFLDELPPGRLPVQTIVVSSKHRPDVIARVRNNCIQKKQAYWVCPLIEESTLVYYEAVEVMFKKLKSYLPDLRLELIHGRLSSQEKEVIMRKFKEGDIDLLVATSVIEVGVDISNANLMIIENAERLGLAQLHQLRGRVGRSTIQSYCVLLYERLSPIAKKRLSIMRQSQAGFMIAQHDLELRGPGEIWGLKQTGWQQLRIADLTRDHYLLPTTQKLSDQIINQHPYLIAPLIRRWIKHNDSAYFKT